MDRSQAKQIGEAMMIALAKVEKELGVTFSRGSGKYDANEYSMKVTATLNASDGTSRNKDEVAFVANAYRFGLKESDLGRSFNAQGRTFTICGLKPRSSKYPVLAKDNGGKVFKFPVSMVR